MVTANPGRSKSKVTNEDPLIVAARAEITSAEAQAKELSESVAARDQEIVAADEKEEMLRRAMQLQLVKLRRTRQETTEAKVKEEAQLRQVRENLGEVSKSANPDAEPAPSTEDNAAVEEAYDDDYNVHARRLPSFLQDNLFVRGYGRHDFNQPNPAPARKAKVDPAVEDSSEPLVPPSRREVKRASRSKYLEESDKTDRPAVVRRTKATTTTSASAAAFAVIAAVVVFLLVYFLLWDVLETYAQGHNAFVNNFWLQFISSVVVAVGVGFLIADGDKKSVRRSVAEAKSE